MNLILKLFPQKFPKLQHLLEIIGIEIFDNYFGYLECAFEIKLTGMFSSNLYLYKLTVAQCN